jgi:hypothetical protein
VSRRRDAWAPVVALARKVGNRAFTTIVPRDKPGAAGTAPLSASSFGPRGELQTPLAEGVTPMPFIGHVEQPPTEGRKSLDFEQAGTQKMVPTARDLESVRVVMSPDNRPKGAGSNRALAIGKVPEIRDLSFDTVAAKIRAGTKRVPSESDAPRTG